MAELKVKAVVVMLLISIQLLQLAPLAEAARKVRPRVPWRSSAQFVLEDDLSDEFKGNSLNLTKWDEHGIRNPDTNCPKWNGPPSESNPDYSIFFPASDNPIPGGEPVRQYRVYRGRLESRITPKPLSFFTSREYYCNTTSFTCNHNSGIPCYATNFFGDPLYIDKAKTRYRGISHDKCKISPFCIPHHLHVMGKANRTYYRHVAPHISSKRLFKYGFLEAKVRLPKSSSILAVWMHNDEMVNGYCRYRKMEGPYIRRLECPSLVRSRRWQEIDLLEAMNSDIHKQKYTPNVHAFAANKGEFSSSTAVDYGNGEMGGGPIIVRRMFQLKNPSFSDVEPSKLIDNDFHWNPGSVHELSKPWADKTRTVGVYWSPNEIRFYVDGEEVRRLKNILINQPLYLDLSTALNVGWARETPVESELTRYSKIFYIRAWKVFTKDGEEPPSSLKEDLTMEKRFQPLYGNEMLGVFGRFPYNDNITDFPTIPDPEETLETELLANRSRTVSNSSLGVSENVVERLTSSVSEDGTEEEVEDEEEGGDYFDTSLIRMTRLVQRTHRRFKPAGGLGNLLFSRKRRRMNRRRRNAALANPRRIAFLTWKKKKIKRISQVDDAATTAFEFSNPNKNMAAWASENADGNGQLDDMA